MKRAPLVLRQALTAGALVTGVLAVAGGLPLAARFGDLLSQVLFRGMYYGPVLSRLLLVVVGVAALGFGLHRGLRALASATGTTPR
ncbi:hypothetical protein [Streptomyces parvulus]|uniref:Uncharacterized protein n=1 Tax=Streptomyces parvulus TaxID=146923 RepID=A0A369V293_9ACTN|nr:hypothetical protein [Streptomyces parvulus]RDD86827.1 hypothetical protein DVZ84_22240 [Streptomyces parvulus]